MKNRIATGFDFLSPFYDLLARLIIGKDIVNSQLHFLKSFRECNRLLILGGGSGWILEPLCKACPDIQIDYIDLSPKMINAAKRISGKNVRINFILGTENDIPDRLYDGVITNFYLDMFEKQTIEKVIEKIKGSIAVGMLADFTLLSENPLTVAPERIKDIKVEEVIIGGKSVYKAT